MAGREVLLHDMLESCQRIKRYTQGLSLDQFLKEQLVFDATALHITILGEKAKKVPHAIREQTPEIDWPAIAKLGDSLMTLPLNIDTDRVWKFVTEEVPVLTREIERLLEVSESER